MAADKYFSPEEYRIHRPNKQGTGSASSFQMTMIKSSYRDVSVFLTIAPQIGADDAGNNKFGWKDAEKRLIMKLNMNDLGELLSVLNGVKPKAGPAKKSDGLFHQSSKGNSVLGFETVKSKDGDILYKMTLSVQRDGEVNKFTQYLSVGDGAILNELFKMAIAAQFKWNMVDEPKS